MTDHEHTIQLAAAVFPNTAEAKASLNELVELHDKGAIELIDAAVMVRDQDGTLIISERGEITPKKGARRGALIGAAVAVLFPPSLLASAALGAAAGAVTGKVTDQGLENEMLEQIAEELAPGKSAIIAVIDHTWYPEMVEAMDGYDRILSRAVYADEAGSITWTE